MYLLSFSDDGQTIPTIAQNIRQIIEVFLIMLIRNPSWGIYQGARRLNVRPWPLEPPNAWTQYYVLILVKENWRELNSGWHAVLAKYRWGLWRTVGGLMLRVDGKMMLAFPCGTSRLLLYQRIFFFYLTQPATCWTLETFPRGDTPTCPFFFFLYFFFFHFTPLIQVTDRPFSGWNSIPNFWYVILGCR